MSDLEYSSKLTEETDSSNDLSSSFLESMEEPDFSEATIVEETSVLTEEEIRKQARELIDKLSSEDIRMIVDESGLEGEDRDRILAGLLGRREYLVKTYGEPEPIAE